MQSVVPIDSDLESVRSIMHRYLGDRDVAGRIGNEHLATGGKRLRALLALDAVAALGAPRANGLAWAAACELLHNGTLVHDDLQDGDRQRRGHPTMWVTHGSAQAINAGDLMLVVPYAMIADVPVSGSVRWQLCHALSTRTAAVIRGQAEEQTLASRNDVGWATYVACVTGKTSALFELPVLGAALIAGQTQTDAASLAAPFRDLGVLFQMQDDVLDCYGDKGRGFVGSDLYEGKVSCLVVAHAELYPSENPAMLALLRSPRETTSTAQVAALIERFRDGGALALALRRVAALRETVLSHAALRSQPALVGIVERLVVKVLAPIAHLYD